jgi:hypothetical protein
MDNSVVVTTNKEDVGRSWCFSDSNIMGNMSEVARYVASLMYQGTGVTEIDIKIKKER